MVGGQVKRIIVEGMDGSGKTTLIVELMERFHFLVSIVNTLGPEQDFDRWWLLKINANRAPWVPIHDRFFYSELVYGPILRGYVKAKLEVTEQVQSALRENALLIYCRPTFLKLDTQPQMEGVIEHTDNLQTAYDQLMVKERTFYPEGRFHVYDWLEAGALPRIETAVENYLDETNTSSLDAATVGGGG